MKNVFYFKNVNSCGGVESWIYYLSKLYNNFIFYYKEADPVQIERLCKNIEVRKYNGEDIECDNFFCNYNPDIIGNVKAKNYINMIHSDYKQLLISPNTDAIFNKNIAVSKLACNSFKEITGKQCEVIYNPVVIDKPKVSKYNDGKLHLISATRLTKEKGLARMQKLAQILEKNNIDYEWIVYTNRKRLPIGNNVIYEDTKLDISEEVAKADYLVQLSDCEAFCYSVVESLIVGTPVICTDLPVFKELEIKHGKNAIVCNMEMSNVDIELIKNGIPNFQYEPPKSEWNKYLDNNGSYNPKDKVKVRTIKRYYDIELEKSLMRGEELEMSKERVSILECKGMVERI